MSVSRVFVANRGEIAVRIVRACHKLGLEAVVGASEPDMDGLAAEMADRVVCIGPASASDSYLRPEVIVQAALGSGCDAIHPGYGFLSERTELARLCEQHGVTFIGPSVAQLAAAGDKLAARRAAEASGVPVSPGGEVTGQAAAAALARDIGLPLLIKAVGGGGGRGMKLVERWQQLGASLEL